MAMVSINLAGATITVTPSSLGEPFFTVVLPSGRQFRASSIGGVVSGAQSISNDSPDSQDVDALNQIIASFAQVQGPAMVAELNEKLAPPPVASAGQEIAEAGKAQNENANTQNPPVPAGNATPASSNAASTESAGTKEVAAPPPKLPSAADPNAPPPGSAPTETLPTTPVPSGGKALVAAAGGSDATQSYIYRAIAVTHMFSKGKFTQQLEGSLVIYDLPTANAAPGSTQSEGNAGEIEAQSNVLTSDAGAGRSTSQYAATDPRRVDTPQATPPSAATPAADSGAASAPTPDTATAPAPETVGPAETAAPTSGGQDVAVAPAPIPPTTIDFAGSQLTASVQISGRVLISLTLPSGQTEINVDGWGDAQWNDLISTLTDTADITSANSLKSSWGPLQSQLRASVAQPVTTSAAPQNMAKEA